MCTLPNIFKGARKRDGKYKHFITSENDKISILGKLGKDLLTSIKHEKYLEESNKDLIKKLNRKYTRQMAEIEEKYEANKNFYKEEKERAISKIKFINKTLVKIQKF